jgi:uncharacterized protein DUF1843
VPVHLHGSRIGKFTLPLVRFDSDSVEAYTCRVFDLTVPFHAGVDMAREPYGPPITDAIARGDVADMKALAAEAERHLRKHGDVRAALEILKVEIARREVSGPCPQGSPSPEPPYGPPIQQAIARGNVAEMKALLKRAETVLAQQGDLATAVALLRTEIAKLEK